MRNDDTRCCGTGTCMINAEGLCWCGQRWDGEKMCSPALQNEPAGQVKNSSVPQEKQSGSQDGGLSGSSAD
jgi:hypothetical protein